MIDKQAPNGAGQITLLGRLTNSLLNRRLGFFVAELILVIAGVLVALAVDGWISDSHDRKTESVYLELLARDIEGIRHQADLQIEFEKEKIDTAARAYAALSTSDPGTKRTEIYSSLSMLVSRRTVSLSSATYDQMVSSGHLQLIRNHELRNRIVRFFATMERNERITDNNNRALIDNVFVPFVMRAGISALPPLETMQVTATLNRGTAIAYERLGPAFSLPEDRILSEPAESDSWNDIRRNVLFRIRIAAAGQALAESTVDEINDIATAIAAELNGR
ncbi:MAG: hypothetical protein OEM64_08460 [Gammaproteobacteria bacterium]|nr:hypothetical protein [Gammaproteobacteria bacterium]MDH3416322.1 hypothetical protein [Gammaproteobacteria bacterium]